MPQTDFFADYQDKDWLVQIIYSLGFKMAPDLNYESPALTYLKDWDAFQSFPSETLFYLVHEDEVRSPLETYCIPSGWRAGKHVIVQRHGGPALTFSVYNAREECGQRILGSGHISYYATYKNTLTGEHEKISPALRSHYRNIVKYIRACGRVFEDRCMDGGVRQYWILPHALEAIRNGARLGDGFDEVFARSEQR